jgi:hypothetical protein
MKMKYGVKNGFQLDSVKDKCRKIWKEKYGVDNPALAGLGYRWHDYVLPSGRKIKYQGYEHFGIRYLLKEYSEMDIEFDRKKIPTIKYVERKKSRNHYPDFFIKSKNMLIDIKSEFTYKVNKKTMQLKMRSAKKLGFDYKILIFDRKGDILQTI